MVKTSVIMTLFNREPEIILSTLRTLRGHDLSEFEVIVVDDNSDADYRSKVVELIIKPILAPMNGRIVEMAPYDSYHIQGFKNPAKAFNRALDEAVGERLIIMSSDVLAPARVMEKALTFEPDETIFCPMVIDIDTGGEYCGPNRVFPMPWFLGTSTAKARACGGWDENYMLGMCYEDNDFVARLALEVGSVTYDWGCIVWHQSHYQPAYRVDQQWVAMANQRNKVYTADKWKGIPFDESIGQVWDIQRGRHVNGDFQQKFIDSKNILADLKAKTLRVPAGV